MHDAYTSQVLIGTAKYVYINYAATTPSFSSFFGITQALLTGEVTLTQGSTTITGTGTSFESEVTVGNTYFVGSPFSGNTFTVASIESNTSLTATVAPSASYSPLPYGLVTSSGSAWPGSQRCIDGKTVAEIPGFLYRVEEVYATVPPYTS